MTEGHDICIVGLKCYDLLANSPVPKYLGGIERILVAFARGLVAKGVKVAFVTYDHGQKALEVHDGISVIKAHDPEAGMAVFRFIVPRMTGIWRAMRQADASYYIQMGAGVETLATALGARYFCKGRRRFVFCTASNMDCELELSGVSAGHEKVAYKQGLSLADRVICQTEQQSSMMLKHYDRKADVIPMPLESPGAQAKALAEHAIQDSTCFDLLWVGRTVEVKRIEWFLDLAERIPQATFHVVGSANQSSEYVNEQMARAQSINNVVVHGRISDEALDELYRKAYLLCCTSIVEGFPTTFLEAWKIGLPVITTFDPDETVQQSGAGHSVESLTEFEAAIRRVRDDRSLYKKMSAAGLKLYQESFSPDVIIDRYLALIQQA